MSKQQSSDSKLEQSSENGTEKQQGLSQEVWTAISAVAVALIGAIVTITTTLLSQQPSQNPTSSTSPSGSVTPSGLSSSSSPLGDVNSPRSPSIPSPTIVPSPSLSAQSIAQDLESVNIDFSDSKELDYLSNPFSHYPQLAMGCLKLLSEQRLKQKVHFDVIFWYYTEELEGKINPDSPDGDVDTNILRAAIISAYNTRNGSNSLSFGDIVEPKQ